MSSCVSKIKSPSRLEIVPLESFSSTGVYECEFTLPLGIGLYTSHTGSPLPEAACRFNQPHGVRRGFPRHKTAANAHRLIMTVRETTKPTAHKRKSKGMQ